MKAHPGYLALVPRYGYDMPCGRTFHSYTPSISDRGWHRFPCACGENHAVRDKDLVEHRPRVKPKAVSYEAKDYDPKPRRPRAYGDGELADLYDMALIKQRIAKDLMRDWEDNTIANLAQRHGVSQKTVQRVGEEVGVYDRHER